MRLCLLILLTLFLMTKAVAQVPYLDKVYPDGTLESEGYDVFVQNDSNYFIGGVWVNPNRYGRFIGMQISKNGDTILHQSLVATDSISYFPGGAGTMKKLPSGGYYTCLNRYYWYTGTGGDFNQAAGMAVTDTTGDTVFTRVYTDTSLYREGVGDIIRLRDGSYMLAGVRNYRSTHAEFGLLIHADSAGNFINEHVYVRVAWEKAQLDRLQLLPDGHVLLGAESDSLILLGSSPYYKEKPWFIVIDTSGAVIRDTVYAHGYAGGGRIHTDLNGGYFHTGALDIFDSSDLYALTNFPSYIAHLDTNFRITWIHSFADSVGSYVVNAIQLWDSGYLAIGSNNFNIKGWVCRLDKAGNVEWSNTYPTDSSMAHVTGTLTDAKELANGNIVLTGYRTDTALTLHSNEIIWLLLIDSNGCESPGCLTNVGVKELLVSSIAIYPNPNSGKFTITNSPRGKLYVFSILGTNVCQYVISSTNEEITLPPGNAPGNYIGKIFPENGDAPIVFRIVYQP